MAAEVVNWLLCVAVKTDYINLRCVIIWLVVANPDMHGFLLPSHGHASSRHVCENLLPGFKPPLTWVFKKAFSGPPKLLQ